MTEIEFRPPPNIIVSWLKHFYIRHFTKCPKCGERVDPDEGYWHLNMLPPIKSGYYHPDCIPKDRAWLDDLQ